FAGTGRFSYAVGRSEAILRLADCPECRGAAAAAPLCRYYEQCFQTLLQTLIDRRVRVRETACVACGAEACTFTVTWR
ncbi:MAG: V4R domain-containing protein, partial [Chloroflexaceae bacterium]